MLSWYIDSSAIIKLIVAEKESPHLKEYISDNLLTSEISRIEVMRTVTVSAPALAPLAKKVLSALHTVDISPSVLYMAENFASDISLRTLDAIHVATALSLQQVIDGVITYDKEMSKDAKSLGLVVVSPGA
ncbi:MAG: PIN domain-containing protein [Actinomycetales bacterium]|nr:MAG: PIN domain-containing protein [Actinomycetales bacterium]